MVDEYHIGANILLAHWHYCNKGSQPFALDWDSGKHPAIVEMNTDQIAFVKETSALVKLKRKSLF